MKVLIIYENVPDTVDVYLIDVTPKDWQWLELTHKHYINQEMPKNNEKACLRLSKRLESEKKLEMDNPINVKKLDIDRVLLTGFLL